MNNNILGDEFMICKTCGKEYDKIFPNCPYCGAKKHSKRNPNEPINSGMKKKDIILKDKFMICKTCGKEYDKTLPNCPFCGAKKENDITVADSNFQKGQTKVANNKKNYLVIFIIGVLSFVIISSIISYRKTVVYYIYDYNNVVAGTLTLKETYSDRILECTYKGRDFMMNFSNNIEVQGHMQLTKTVNGEKYYSSTMSGYSDYYWVMTDSDNVIRYYFYDFQKK